MGLDMYAYKMPLDGLNKWLEDNGDPVGDETWHDFNPRKAARELVGFLHLPDSDLTRLTQLERDHYWDRLRLADKQAKDMGMIEIDYHYWRKFNALHGWMSELYKEKGGKDVFNCTTVRLSKEDLDKLYSERNVLQPVDGFFFGAQEVYEEDVTSLASFTKKAQEDVDTNAIFYDSWW